MKARHITFAVCHFYAQGSVDILKDLIATVPNSSLTIWTGRREPDITVEAKNEIIKKFDNAFLDLRMANENGEE